MSSPIIFEKGTRDFSTLGLGLLSDAIQATTTEELNGQFIFEMDYPVSGNNADLIRENRIIVVNSGHILKRQGFIIRQIVRKIDLTMTVYAEHVSYATLDVALAPMGTISGDAKTALENWKRMLVPAVDFTVDSDILTTNSTSIGAPEFETARQGLGGHAGSILDVWGGEYQFDNWHIRLLKQRGKSANAIIAYGRNLISFEQDTNIADTYTSVYPYYQENSGDDGNKTHFLPERTVDSEFVGKYPNPKVLMLDLSNKFKDVADYSETKLRNYALSYIQSNNIGVPKVNMKISTVDLSRATGGFSEDIDLGDTVNVYFEKLGITTSAKVIKAVWNVLSDDYDKFEIGARRASLTESISELATTADENANKALNQALVALQSADGKSTIYYLNSSDPWPTNPNENDTAFVKDGENSIMYRYMFNNDTGMFSWVKILDSMSADQIKQRVSDALESGKAYSDQLVADNVAQVNAVLDDVQAKQADLTAQQAELETKAQGYADKALADAKANTLATATQTAKDAQDALDSAKTDLTTSLNKEVTDRANAVTALDTKAKGYADTAKTDAINAATTADGVINKKIDDTASSITSTISQNKTDADGKITTAQSTATQALNGLATKVSQTVYDAKTGQLQTDLNTTTTTANQAKTDIVAIKSDNTKQDARMTTIESDANGTKTTVSNLQTDLGKANGSITTLQQRADGFDATVTKVNSMAVGGRNWLLNSKAPNSATGNNATNQIVIGYGLASGMNSGKMVSDWGAGTYITLSFDWAVTGTVTSGTFIPQFYPQPYSPLGPQVMVSSTNTSGHYTGVKVVGADWAGTSAPTIDFRLDGFQGVFTVSNIKLEQGNMPTAWTPAPEDVDSATAKAQLTADQATTSLNTYKSDADGRISKAQADIIVNANAITQKVSQSDYNAKTGDLTTKVNTAQSTADSATSTIGAYKTSNDARVASAESKITANATAITSKVSQTDYNTKTGQIDGQISTINQTAGKISQSVADVNGRIDNISVGGTNLLLGSQDFTGTGTERWVISGTIVANAYQGLSAVQSAGAWSGPKYQESNLVARWGALDTTNTFTLSEWVRNTSTTQVDIKFYGDNVQGGGKTVATLPANSDWVRVSAQFKFLVATPSSGARIRFEPITGVTGGYVQHAGMKLESGTLASSYSPAPEDTDNKISIVSQTVDSISSIVSDPTTGLTKRVQTAEGSISTVQSNVSDLQSKQTQTANGLTTEISNRQTGDTNTLTQAKDFTTSSISNSESGMKSLVTQTSDAILAQISSTGVRYVRINGQGNQDNAGTHFMRVSLFDSSGKDLLLGKTATVSGQNSPYFGGNNGGNGATDGNVNTYSAIYPEPNANNFMVYDLGAVTYTPQKFEVKMLTNYRTYKGVTIQVSPDNKSWRTILQENVKSISNDITKPDTTINLGGTSSATQLALLKDNWSIGIADNAGAITNGIVGNSTNMSLISNNVVINAPSTQIKGTAWINSAMIGNGAIGTAQIGDASITSAKIASLDVAKLTGNVSNFIQSNWNGVFASTMIDNTGMSINGGNTTTKFDTSGAHYSNGSGINATYSFGKWSDQSGNATSSTGLYLGATGSENSFINILGTNGAAALVLAGTAMDFGSNLNVLQGALNAYVNVNIRERLMFKANRYVGGQPSYIEVDEINRTFNFFTGGGSGTNKDYFYFNQNVISAGTFSSTSVLSKKNVKSVYDEDALGEIAKTQLVNFEYKNRIGQNHVSPIIDDVNSEKEYYIPKTILGQDNEYVDMYSMISMAWKAIQQLNEKIGEK
ncbi:phage tail spike protein [Leuconostoc lactis]|uniref:phage tail spike protein n=1 Tax=Leuconostoc lactis TaxID=1246 RepID=UPI00101F9A6D|nr:phage tail spike protein [Leuconostoc lactis]MSB66649.1 hypothetical protein [Leuconostoc lactis]RYS88555.1 hypothetical protein EAI73_03840 [Leuconostoc lactis]